MTRRSQAVRMFDFSGGLNTMSPVTALKLNESLNLQNINLLPSGGFESRLGNTTFNSSAMNSGADVQGMGYYRQANQTEFLMAVAGNAAFKSDSLDGTMDSVTGTGTFTGGQDNIYTHFVFDDNFVFVGGPEGAATAPATVTGSGNFAALGGSPPSGGFGLVANRRAFIGDVNSNRSRIQWSILGSAADWTNAGSGSQDVDENDGDNLTGAAVLNVDHMLLFKQNSIHDLIIRTDPFPLFPLFRNVGSISKRGIVYVDGLVYFITAQPRMKATNGTEMFEFPDTIDDIWDDLNTSRLKFLHGVHYRKRDQIIWTVSKSGSSEHDLAIIWDLKRKAWLRHTEGYKMNVSTIAQDRDLYGGDFDGVIFKQDVSATHTDASETSPGNINAFWRTGWNDLNTMTNSKVLSYVDLNFTTQTTGTFDFAYGFDFSEDKRSVSINMKAPGDEWDVGLWDVAKWGGQLDKTKLTFTRGQGKHFQLFIRRRDQAIAFSFNGLEFPIKTGQQAGLK